MNLVWVLLATAGCTAFLYEKTELPAAFCPAVAICGQILFLYLLSLLGWLKFGPVLLAAMTLLLLRKRKTEKPLLTPGVA